MPRDIRPFETSKRTHPDIVKLREQKRINEMPAIDCELRIIDGLLRDLEPRWPRSEKAAATSPIELGCHFFRAGNEQRQMNPIQIMTFDHIRMPLVDERSDSTTRVSLGFLVAFCIVN